MPNRLSRETSLIFGSTSSRKGGGLPAKHQRTIRCGMWVHITAPMALLPWTANLEETGYG